MSATTARTFLNLKMRLIADLTVSQHGDALHLMGFAHALAIAAITFHSLPGTPAVVRFGHF